MEWNRLRLSSHLARDLERQERTAAVTEHRERFVLRQLLDDRLCQSRHPVDRTLVETPLASRQLNRTDFTPVQRPTVPVPKDGGAASSVRKAEQSRRRGGIRVNVFEPCGH